MSKHTGARSIANVSGISRREFLQAGGTLGVLGLTVPDCLSVPATSGNSGILIFNGGGLSHLDSWDPKPDAPRPMRSPFGVIRTRGDFQITNLFPGLAAVADKFSIVRSVSHPAAALHDVGSRLVQTGCHSSGGIHFPHVGCVIDFVRGRSGDLPGHVMLGGAIAASAEADAYGQTAGFLGTRFAPFVPSMSPTPDRVRDAFDLGAEPMFIRERYGMHRLGRRFLLARRLIEHGVRFVTVNTSALRPDEATWDIHGARPFGSFDQMRNVLAPMYDQACSALIEDLDQRGMLDRTLVAAFSEFGRSPLINADGGRDHWAQCWSVWFAGGGVKGGRAIGSSDEIGATPAESPFEPRNLVATVYKAIGVDPCTMLPGPDGAAFPLVDPGTQAIKELF